MPGQGNNAYVFPGVGLGVIASRAHTISDDMFLAASRVLAAAVTEEDLSAGTVYSPLNRIRRVSRAIAVAVAEIAWEEGLAQEDRPEDIERTITELMYEPGY